MHKKLALLLSLFLLVTEIPSCSFTGLSAQNLMTAPKANADQQAIYRQLQGTQTDVNFVYPRNGSYRSAIIMEDFTGNGVEDAIGFHSVENSTGVGVQFLVKEEGRWLAAAAFQNVATQVDRVCFANLAGGRKAVLIGWGSTAGATGRTAELKAYVCDGRDVEEYSLGNYGEMALTDFNGDGVHEVFTIDKYIPAEEDGSEPSPAMARLFLFRQDEPYQMTYCQADNDISNYSSVSFGQLNAQSPAVVVDGSTASGITTTQIFRLEGLAMKSLPDNVNQEDYVNPFARPSGASFSAQDINGDGYLEFPAVSLLPGLSGQAELDSTSYLVEWQAITGSMGFQPVLRALMNTRENYWFRLPFPLQGRVCAVNDPKLRTVTYTQVIPGEDGSELLGSTLFSIRVFTLSSWESRGETSGYTRRAGQNDSVYGIQILTKDQELRRYVEDIAKGFQLMAE